MPAAKKASSGRPTISASDVQNTGNCWPVAIWRWRARRATNQLMAIASSKASAISHDAVAPDRLRQEEAATVQIGAERQMVAVARQRQHREHAEYQKKMTSSGGMLRKIST